MLIVISALSYLGCLVFLIRLLARVACFFGVVCVNFRFWCCLLVSWFSTSGFYGYCAVCCLPEVLVGFITCVDDTWMFCFRLMILVTPFEWGCLRVYYVFVVLPVVLL